MNRSWKRTVAGFRVVAFTVVTGVALLLSWSFGAVHQAGAAPGDPEFHIGINTDGAGGDDCSTLNDTKGFCSIPLGSMFVVNGYLDSLGSTANYPSVSVWEDYAGVTSKGVRNSDAHPWPDCGLEGIAAYPGYIVVGCVIGLGQPLSTYTGKVTTATYTCAANGIISLRHGLLNTSVNDLFEEGPDQLNIYCVSVPPTPSSTPTNTATLTPIVTPTFRAPPPLGGVAAYPELPGSANVGLAAGAAGAAVALIVALGGLAWRQRVAGR